MGLLDDLQNSLETNGTTKILASLKHDSLNFSNENDIRIFIPDLHLLSSQARSAMDATGPHPSHAMLLNVLRSLSQFRASVKAQGDDAVCAVYFMGDMFDLWREAAPGTSATIAAGSIIKDHLDLMAAACSPDLKARFILGNHDFHLYEVASFGAADRRYFFPAVGPTALCLHGDVFDWVEDFPDLLEEAVVYYTSPFVSLIDHFQAEVTRCFKPDNNDPPEFVQTDAITPCATLDEAGDLHPLWNRAWSTCQKSNHDFNLGIRSVVIGHTHNAKIVAYENGSDFLALIDTGAWLQDTLSNDGAPQEQGTIGALCANEARIFHMVSTNPE